ncbi:hypothetical protein [Geomonas agri]|uniref:hypothetical protein n=1 Tax=Geomonas agri TaxID=2873702 RepID=UPI001CD752D1|nr:hypothetical protein [Geomonas agri]
MNLVDMRIKSAFRTSPEGTRIYYPFGCFGKGRIVVSEQIYQKVVSHISRWIFLSLGSVPLLTGLMKQHSWKLLIIVMFFLSLAQYISTYLIIKNLPISDVRITYKEIFDEGKSNFSKIMTFSVFTNWFLVISGTTLFLLGILVVLAYRDRLSISVGAFLTAIGFISIIMSMHSMSKRRTQHTD